MRQLRFIFIALTTSLFVTNTIFLRLYGFLNEDETANAATPLSKQSRLYGSSGFSMLLTR